MKKLLALAFTAIFASSAYLAVTSSAAAHGIGWRHSHGGFSIGIYSGRAGPHGLYGPRYRCYGRGCYQPRYRHYDPYYGHRRIYRDRVIIYERPRRIYRRHHRRVHRSDRHTRWCYNRYRSYRAWDNTFQPYHGRRRACRSPYY